MAFSFGAAAQPAAQPSGGLFGQQAQASTSTSSPFSGFGGASAQPAAQPAATSSPFGSFGAASTQPATNAFGANANATSSGSGTSLFGAQQAKPAGGLFGSTPAAPASTPTGGGLFGSTTTAPAAGGGLFGSTNTAPAQPAAAGGGLFGSTTNTAQPATGGGLFGSTAAKPAGGLFGSTAQPAQTGGGLFGAASTAQPAAGGGLFGSASTAAQPAAGGGLFGSAAQPAQGGSLFGASTAAKPAGGLFGSAAPAQPQGGLFASTAQPLGQSVAQQQEQPQDIESRIVAIKNAWDDNSPDCRFKYFFYNVVDPGTSQAYGRPAGANDDAKWARAVRDNPDPANMVPVLATGWTDVKKRVQMQEQVASVHQQRIRELNAALAQLSRQSALSSSVRLQALQSQLQQLTDRLLHLAAQSPSFAPVQSAAFRPEEGEMKHTLEEVKDALDGRTRAKGVGLADKRGGGKGRMLGQVNELWGAVEEVRRLRRARGAENAQWVGDEKLLTEIAVVLDQQQSALSKLSQLATDNVFDADVIRAGLDKK